MYILSEQVLNSIEQYLDGWELIGIVRTATMDDFTKMETR